MTVHIDQVVSDVSVEPPSAAGPTAAAQQTSPWMEQIKLATLRARLLRDELRTRSSGYDD